MKSTAESPSARLADCRELLGKYQANAAHAEKVAELSNWLFTAMSSLHGLLEEDRETLVACALLHDVGHLVGEKRHHWHGAYIVAADEALDDWDDSFRETVALVVLNHRKRKCLNFKTVDRATRKRVRRLASMLRIADLLDRGGQQTAEIQNFVFDAIQGEGEFRLSGIDLLELEPVIGRKVGWATRCWGVELTFVCGDVQILVKP
jgi:exopolyphosphatase/pppGpp-phosphohydrolase